MIKSLMYKINQIDLFKYIVKKIGEKLNYNYRISINGKNFFIPIIKNIGYGNIVADDGLWMSDLLIKLLKIKSGLFIDIRANIGQSLLQLKSIDDDKIYIGFEPNPTCASYIRALIKKNKFKNCIFVPIGLFNENKLINLHLSSETDSGAQLLVI